VLAVVRHKLLEPKWYGHTYDAVDIDEPVRIPLDGKRSPIDEPGELFRLSAAAVACLNRLASRYSFAGPPLSQRRRQEGPP